MKKKDEKKYALFLISLILIISFFDWYEHISRKNSLFETYPLKWLLYTYTSCFVLIISTLFFNLVLKTFIKFRYLKEILALLIGITTFQLTGNHIKQITVPEIELHFHFNFIPIAVILILYSVIYFAFNYFIERKQK
jgi:hypothetical protein